MYSVEIELHTVLLRYLYCGNYVILKGVIKALVNISLPLYTQRREVDEHSLVGSEGTPIEVSKPLGYA